MGIDVRIINESDQEIALLLDSGNLTKRLIPELSNTQSQCLRFIDPYGETVFNTLQIPVLINELESTLLKSVEPEVRNHGMAIIELARRVQTEVHQYLKFYGD